MKILFLVFFFTFRLLAKVITADLEYQKITSVDYTWRHINFENSYSDAIVVCSNVLPSNLYKEAVVRVNNISSSGFDVKIQTPDDVDPAYSTDVYCIVSDEGSYSIPIKYEAHKVISTSTNGASSPNDWTAGRAEDVSSMIVNSYSKPAVLGQVMSFNDNRFSTFWSFDCDNRKNRPFQSGMSDGICVGKHVGEIAQERANETLGFIVAEAGVYELKDFSMAVDYGADAVKGVGNNPAYTYTLDKEYTHGVVTHEAEDGSHGGWAVLYGSNPLGSSLDLAIDEETVAGDTTRTHTTENVAYWVFLYAPINSAEMKINEVLYQQSISGSNTDEFIEFYVTKTGDLKNYLFSDQDGATHHYRFQKHSVVEGDYVIFHIGSGTDSVNGNVHHFYNNSSEILNNTGDDILLLKPSNSDVTVVDNIGISAIPFDYVSYDTGSAVDTVPTSINGVTLNWDSSDNSRIKDSEVGTSISLTPNAEDSDSSICWEITATTIVSEKASSCTNYISTRDTNSDATLTYSIGESNTASANLKLTKSSCVIEDPINGTTNPKRTTGATIRYALEVQNSGEADANEVKVEDSLSAEFDTTTIGNLQIKSGQCDCLGVSASSNNGANGTANGVNPIVLDFGDVGAGTVSNPTVECGYFEVKLF